jgi:hypothetical protein
MIKLTVIEEPTIFFEKTRFFLNHHEAENNVIIGLTKQLIDSQSSKKVQTFFAIIEEDNKLVLSAMINPPKDLILSTYDNIPIEALQVLTDFIWQSGIPLNGVAGSRRTAQQFAAIWSHRAAVISIVKMEEFIYRLDKVIFPVKFEGILRNAKMDDFNLVAKWMSDFHKEALNEPLSNEQYQSLEEQIVSDNVYLWQHEIAVSMAMKNRETDHGAVIGYVYTPPGYRCKGYGSAISAGVSARLLNNGYEFCTLFTDAANKISNSIYRRIGYKVLDDVLLIRFSKESEYS